MVEVVYFRSSWNLCNTERQTKPEGNMDRCHETLREVFPIRVENNLNKDPRNTKTTIKLIQKIM